MRHICLVLTVVGAGAHDFAEGDEEGDKTLGTSHCAERPPPICGAL